MTPDDIAVALRYVAAATTRLDEVEEHLPEGSVERRACMATYFVLALLLDYPDQLAPLLMRAAPYAASTEGVVCAVVTELFNHHVEMERRELRRSRLARGWDSVD